MLLLWSPLVFAADAVAPSDSAALLASYDAVRVALVENRIDAAREGARALASDVSVPVEVATAARQVADASDDSVVRTTFGALSKAIVIRFEATAVPEGMRVYHCPMATAYSYWLQPAAGIANPYMGTSMPTCGEGTSFKAALKAAAEPSP